MRIGKRIFFNTGGIHVGLRNSDEFRDGWERTFGHPQPEEKPEQTQTEEKKEDDNGNQPG